MKQQRVMRATQNAVEVLREQPLFNPWQAEHPEEAEYWYGDLAPPRGRHRPPINEWDDPTWVSAEFDLPTFERLREFDEENRQAHWKRGGHDSGFVYYATSGEGLIKIGTSLDPERRLRAIGCRTLLALEPGGHGTEKRRHRQFAHLRVKGEWFKAAPELHMHIANLFLQEAVAS